MELNLEPQNPLAVYPFRQVLEWLLFSFFFLHVLKRKSTKQIFLVVAVLLNTMEESFQSILTKKAKQDLICCFWRQHFFVQRNFCVSRCGVDDNRLDRFCGTQNTSWCQQFLFLGCWRCVNKNTLSGCASMARFLVASWRFVWDRNLWKYVNRFSPTL